MCQVKIIFVLCAPVIFSEFAIVTALRRLWLQHSISCVTCNPTYCVSHVVAMDPLSFEVAAKRFKTDTCRSLNTCRKTKYYIKAESAIFPKI
jgi:hypothetical protein